jgi:hypothetical protein
MTPLSGDHHIADAHAEPGHRDVVAERGVREPRVVIGEDRVLPQPVDVFGQLAGTPGEPVSDEMTEVGRAHAQRDYSNYRLVEIACRQSRPQDRAEEGSWRP